MLACIPTKGDAGLDDYLHDHFGSAPYFTLYDTTTESVTVVPNGDARHKHGTCHPMSALETYRIDCVICAGMGRRAIETLNREGIKVYCGKPGSLRSLVEAIKNGELEEMDPERACQGHGQHADTTHECGGRRDRGFSSGRA
jgi:ArsR family transcriptional regulator